MKTVKVTTNNTVSVIDIDFDNFREIQKTIGGHFETVHAPRMEKYFGDPSIIMLVDEEGLLKSLPMNFFGSRMYGLLDHGHPIVGDLILAKINLIYQYIRLKEYYNYDYMFIETGKKKLITVIFSA